MYICMYAYIILLRSVHNFIIILIYEIMFCNFTYLCLCIFLWKLIFGCMYYVTFVFILEYSWNFLYLVIWGNLILLIQIEKNSFIDFRFLLMIDHPPKVLVCSISLGQLKSYNLYKKIIYLYKRRYKFKYRYTEWITEIVSSIKSHVGS